MSSLEIIAQLSKLIYQSEQGNFAVAEFIDSTSARRFKSSGNIILSPKADIKQRYRLIGEWQKNPKYGETFAVVYAEAMRPEELKGLVPYLAHNVKGVGEATAKKLVEKLNVQSNEELVDICKNNQSKIYDFFGEKKKIIAGRVIDIMVTDEVFRSIMIFLYEHNIPTNFSKKIYQKYGVNSVQNLKENPYRLISDFRNVGFLKADAIASKIGIEKTSLFRIEAALIFSLEQALDDGHCYLPRDVLIEKACVNLGSKTDSTFSYDFVLEETRKIYKKNRAEKKEHFLIREVLKDENDKPTALFYLPEILVMEDEVGGFLTTLVRNSIGHEFKEKKILEDVELGYKTFEEQFTEIPWSNLSDEQKQAVNSSFSARVMILTGGPGCGKTFVLKSIFKLQKALHRKVALCAPTGLAAKRMTSSIGELAVTIHKLLGLGKKEEKQENTIEESENFLNDSKPLSKVDVIVVDESSMLSLDLLHALLKAAGPNKRFIFVGDVDQLPSVGAGNCLRDMIASLRIPTVRLTKIFRQGLESPIPMAARNIIQGAKPNFTSISYTPHFTKQESFAFIPCSKETFFEGLIPFLKETMQKIYNLDPVKDCQILVPMRRSDVGGENINKTIQNVLNSNLSGKLEYKHPAGFCLRTKDKVIQTKNNYELDVFNGDLGFIRSIEKSQDTLEITVDFSHKSVTYIDEQAEELQLCYAMTIHKSQGSEFPLCIIPMFGVYYTMLERNLLYTAVTRASKHVIIMGEEWALKKTLATQNSIKRFTSLEKLLTLFT